MQNSKNVIWATIISAIILVSWSWFYEKPRAEKLLAEQKAAKESKPIENSIAPAANNKQTIPANPSSKVPDNITLVKREEAIEQSRNQRIRIANKELDGSINLKGARFDDIKLFNYRETIDKNSKEVALLSPIESSERYFVDFGWISESSQIDLPTPNTIWQADKTTLTPQDEVNLSWKNKQNILFVINIKMDDNYMFSVTQIVKNLSKDKITLLPYGRVNRILKEPHKSNYILHEGPIGAFDKILHEFNYENLLEENNKNFSAKKGWLGITDKYWLTTIIPDNNLEFQGKFSHEMNGNNSIYNAEFIGKSLEVSSGSEVKLNHNLFVGAKQVKLLDQYSKKYDIDLFDRTIDFGWYYFLTKPFFFILQFFNELLGNYGLAILAMTVLIKLLMFPLANKSYLAMDKIKKLHPKIEAIRKADKGDRMKINRDIMELYKKEKVNPASGCLPMLIQIPVFFSLYKVLYVTLDMRHAPFFGWIKDLSAPDPTSIVNLFGLLPFETHGFITIGVWPILMGMTMIIQQKLGPEITDPAQAKVMKILPYILIFVFAAFPAGLLIYWTWSNTLSIIQQSYITRRHKKG